MRFAIIGIIGLVGCTSVPNSPEMGPMRIADMAFIFANDCSDGKVDGEETDVDCGGSVCGACDIGRACLANRDCKSALCTHGVCAAPSCKDGMKDGDETDADCGGSVCPNCPDGKSCLAPSDCMSGMCTTGTCQSAPTCKDGIKNGAETDVDCGGGTCSPCPDGKLCMKGSDCEGGSCVAGVCKTQTMIIGNSVPYQGMLGTNPGVFYGFPITVPKPVTLLRIGVVLKTANGEGIYGLYTDKNGPDQLVASTAITPFVVGSQEVNVQQATPLPAGKYWITCLWSGGADPGADNNVMNSTYAHTKNFNTFKYPLPQTFPPFAVEAASPANFWVVVK